MPVLTRRTKPIAMGLLRTTPFTAAGILSLVLFYVQAGTAGVSWHREPVIVLVFILLCWTVFYTVSQQLPYSKKNVIEDLLQAAVVSLGSAGHRANVMELRTSEDNAFHSYFQITHGYGYANQNTYREKITLDVPGASTAYKDRKVVYLPKSELRNDLDPAVKHLWSAPIRNRRGVAVAVLNIDNVHDDTLAQTAVDAIKGSINELAQLVGYYWELPA